MTSDEREKMIEKIVHMDCDEADLDSLLQMFYHGQTEYYEDQSDADLKEIYDERFGIDWIVLSWTNRIKPLTVNN